MSKPEYPYSILLLGADDVGRTSMTLQFALGYIIEQDPTIHDTFKKRIEFEDDVANVEITDTGTCPHGPGCYHIQDSDIKVHEGFMLIYSITNRPSFDQIRPTYDRIKHVKDGRPFFVVIVSSKNDLEGQRRVSVEEGKNLAQELGCHLFQICAKNPTDVEQTFMALIHMMRQRWLSKARAIPAERTKGISCSVATCVVS